MTGPTPTTTAPAGTTAVSSSRRTCARAFRVAATVEAISWAALIVAMFFKWVTHTTERAVQIVGPIHGTLFVLYCLSVLWCWRAQRWSIRDTIVGLISSVPPFATIWFEGWMQRRGQLPTG